MINQIINTVIDWIVIISGDILMPLMILMLTGGLVGRALIYFTISRESWFSDQLEKRANARFDADDIAPDASFYVTMKRLLEKNYYELFVVRSIMKRRRPDSVATLSDRLFLIQHGCARLVKSTLRQIRFLKYEGQPPRFLDISKNVFETNQCFNKIFGVVPTNLVNDVLNILPGLFIIGGIFGTFLGIMKGLPSLGGMDLADVEGSKKIMDEFLLKAAYAMGSSILGMVCSVVMTVANTALAPEKIFITAVNRFEAVLSSVWMRCTHNQVPANLSDFDEHKDSLEALAEQAVEQEAAKKVPLIRDAS
jgi:hypothetical protein